MTSKRILVRVINHTLGLDQHLMVMSAADQVALTTSNLIADLVATTGCPIVISATTLLDKAKTYGSATHATHLQAGWLIQLRLDDKQIVGSAAAANDNQPIALEVNQ